MDSSNPFERKIINEVYELEPFHVTASRKKPKSKKRKLPSDLLKLKLAVGEKKSFHRNMKKQLPKESISKDALSQSSNRRSRNDRRVDIRKAEEAFKTAKKAARKTRQASKK